MKNIIKSFIKELPYIKKLIKKNDELEKSLEVVRIQAVHVGREAVSLRLKLKKINKEKINVVFVCHRPAVWESLHSVYDALKNDEMFNTYIVAIPSKNELPKLGFNHEVYESEGAEEYWKEYGCINGYNYETKKWFDLKELKPDYVFFQQPYNVTRCEAYKSWNVAQYAKICYVPYAFDFIGNGVLEETTPKDFIQDVSFYFTENEIDNCLINRILNNYSSSEVMTFNTGFPRYDGLLQYKNSTGDAWNFVKHKTFRIMWTPRWCTNEGNCNFFEYKDLLVDYMKNRRDVSFLFRPHPQAFVNWNKTGELSDKDSEIYKELYNNSSNMRIDCKKDYFDTIFGSDCLITDTSSFIADYFMTGKPIVYCHKKDTFNEISRKMSEGFYWVHNWSELKQVLDDLIAGKDELREKRHELVHLFFDEKQNASNLIKNIMKDTNSY